MKVKTYFSINTYAIDVKNIIIDSIERKIPQFLLRIGDGEMILIKKDSRLENFCQGQIGRTINSLELDTSIQNLNDSIINSTILGLPTSKHIKLNELWKSQIDYYEFLKNKSSVMWDKKYCSIDIHTELLSSGIIFDIFNYVNDIVVVSPRNIVNELKLKYNISSVTWYNLPGEQKYESISNTEIDTLTRIDDIVKLVRSSSQKGKLLIFGAGPFGKIIGNEFYKMGGISLDLGSVFDSFVGKKTRGVGKGKQSFTDRSIDQ